MDWHLFFYPLYILHSVLLQSEPLLHPLFAFLISLQLW
jgi:hypothetical protein